MTNRELIDALKAATLDLSEQQVSEILEINGQTFFARQSPFVQESSIEIMLEELAKAMSGLCSGAISGVRQQLEALK